MTQRSRRFSGTIGCFCGDRLGNNGNIHIVQAVFVSTAHTLVFQYFVTNRGILTDAHAAKNIELSSIFPVCNPFKTAKIYWIIRTNSPESLSFQWIPGFLVTSLLLVQYSSSVQKLFYGCKSVLPFRWIYAP